jgi:hypothetical protein
MNTSSSQEEYVAILETVKDIKFAYHLLQDVGIEVELTIVGKTDNIGVILILKHESTRVGTQHIDNSCHFIQESTTVGIELVRLNEKYSDYFTKNMSGESYNKNV